MKITILLGLSLAYVALSTATPVTHEAANPKPSTRASITCKKQMETKSDEKVPDFGTTQEDTPLGTVCLVDNGGVKLVSDMEVGYRCFNGVCPPYPTLSWRLTWPVAFYNYFMIHFWNGNDCELTLDNIAQYCIGDRCAKDITEYQFPVNSHYMFEINTRGKFPAIEYTDKCQLHLDPWFKVLPTNPGPILSPRIVKTSRTGYRVFFDKPAQPNGPINYYHVVQYNTESVRKDFRFPAQYTETGIGVQCVNEQTLVGLYIAVAASNVLSNGTEYVGPLSEWTYLEFCKTACPECAMDIKDNE